ncbi:MAG: serine hydrolase [Clostridia bacterium]|nr:serine hydrolase [Clostridia bacterium]MBR6743778.1 serine hydrolase [Clostridia bacterium]
MEIFMYQKALAFFTKLYNNRDEAKYYGAHPMKPKLPTRTPVKDAFPRATPESVGIRSEHIYAFIKELSEMTELAPHLLMITKDNRIISETEFYPYRMDTWHVSHSLCKSITAIAVGLAVEDGILSLDEKITDIFSKRAFSIDFVRQKDITVRHLLNMSAGCAFNELGSVTYEDWVEGYFSSNLKFTPGAKFFYNSMNSYMLSAVIKEKTGRDMFELLYERIFLPMGITEVCWEKSPKGITKGGWGLYMKLEDTMKFGKLFLDGGVWKGERLISEEWIGEMTKKQIDTPDSMNLYGYGYHVWMGAREGSYQFNGMFGQNLFVFPDIRMTVGIYSGGSEFFPTGKLTSLVNHYFGDHYHPAEPLRPSRHAYGALRALNASLALPKPQSRQEKMQKCAALMPIVNKSYCIDGKNASILPVTLSLLHANFAGGIQKISFRLIGETVEATFRSPIETVTIPFSVSGTAHYFDLTENDERFSAASIAKMTKNEDDVPVFKLSVYFLETTAVRHVKIFFHHDKTVVRFSEEPTGSDLLETFSPVLGDFIPDNKALKNLLAKTDSNMLYELFDKLFTLQFTVKK